MTISIKNEDMKIDMVWDLWGAEVDLLSILICGKKKKLPKETVHAYIQGVMERLILENVSEEHKRDIAAISAMKSGLTKGQLQSYLRGWDQVGNAIETKE